MKSKSKKNRYFITLLSILFILSFLIYSSVPGSPLNSVTSPLSFITDPIQSGVTMVSDKIFGFFDSLTNGIKIREENKKLKEENAKLEQKVKQLEENGRKWDELKNAFKIKEIFSDFDILGATILTREIGQWFDVFRINVGTRENILIDDKTSFAVVDSQMNLVGRVISSDYTSSKILPILNEGSVVSAKINNGIGSIVRVRGDLQLKENACCIIDKISDFSSIKVGDEIITSGLGGLYPPGIPIGKVIELINDDQKIEKRAVLKIYSNMNSISDVFIMKGKLTY